MSSQITNCKHLFNCDNLAPKISFVQFNPFKKIQIIQSYYSEVQYFVQMLQKTLLIKYQFILSMFDVTPKMVISHKRQIEK
jgi:hypothetical protein